MSPRTRICNRATTGHGRGVEDVVSKTDLQEGDFVVLAERPTIIWKVRSAETDLEAVLRGGVGLCVPRIRIDFEQGGASDHYLPSRWEFPKDLRKLSDMEVIAMAAQ